MVMPRYPSGVAWLSPGLGRGTMCVCAQLVGRRPTAATALAMAVIGRSMASDSTHKRAV